MFDQFTHEQWLFGGLPLPFGPTFASGSPHAQSSAARVEASLPLSLKLFCTWGHVAGLVGYKYDVCRILVISFGMLERHALLDFRCFHYFTIQLKLKTS